MKGQNGRIVLPDGMSYRVLILPEDKRVGLEVLRKIRDLVKEGVALVGPKPEVESRAYRIPQQRLGIAPDCR